jgi:hypothetical protein
MKIGPAVALLLLLSDVPLEAKCAFRQYKLKGVVVEDVTHRPVAGASVFVFLDNYDSTYSGGYNTTYPDFFVTSGEGEFVAVSYFYSFRKSSFFWGDVCDKKPKRVELVVTAPGFLTKRVLLSFDDLKRSGVSRLENIVELPPATVKRSK